MRHFFWIGATALFSSAVAQTEAYTDGEGRTFAGVSPVNDVLIGISIPENAGGGEPYDSILQLTVPSSLGWFGVAWGGSMTYNPLTVVWPNENNVLATARMAFGYTLPGPHADATLTMLPGSGTNDTHIVATILCSGCTYWSAPGLEPQSLEPSGEHFLAWAFSGIPVDSPESEGSTFSHHDIHGNFALDFSLAQQADFEEWAAEGEAPPEPTDSAGPTEPSASFTADEPSPSETAGGGTLPVPESCPGVSPFRSDFGTAEGWRAVKIAGGLRTPRGIVLDSNGNLLVVQSGVGVTVHTFGTDGCISGTKTLISNPTLNHGITLTADGSTLYVSSMTTAWEFSYDAAAQTVSNERVVVRGMIQGGHPTRTLIVPPQTPNLLVISLGSFDNIDHASINPETGRAIVRVFDMDNVPTGGYNYNTDGNLFGYGLRNGVALVADGNNHIWEVENGADQFQRTVNGNSYDIYADNPAEEMNYLGDPSVENTNWYGYPSCHTVFGAEQLTDAQFDVGDQFVLTPNATFTDEDCVRQGAVPPRLSFQAHSAPMDAAFDRNFENMFITFHGSWNRPTATGYKVVQVAFTQNEEGMYEPVEPANSRDAASDIFWSANEGSCTSGTCFRPCGIVFDQEYTRLFVASDRPAEGELFMLARAQRWSFVV